MFLNIVYYMIKYTLKIYCCSSSLWKNASLIRQGMRERIFNNFGEGKSTIRTYLNLKNIFNNKYIVYKEHSKLNYLQKF